MCHNAIFDQFFLQVQKCQDATSHDTSIQGHFYCVLWLNSFTANCL